MNAIPIVWLALRMSERVEVLGIFITEDEAKAACSRHEDVIGPVPFGVVLLTENWPGAYYPIAQRQAGGKD